MMGGAVQINRISTWLTSLIKNFNKPSISSVTSHTLPCTIIALFFIIYTFSFVKSALQLSLQNFPIDNNDSLLRSEYTSAVYAFCNNEVKGNNP